MLDEQNDEKTFNRKKLKLDRRILGIIGRFLY